MSRLEDLKENATVRGILPNGLVTVVTTKWHGSAALELTYKNAEGKLANELLYRDDELRVEVVEEGRPWNVAAAVLPYLCAMPARVIVTRRF